MGAEQSTLALDSSRGPQYAFRVLRVDADSPAAAARLVPYFDYITSVNGVDVVRIAAEAAATALPALPCS